MINIDTDLSAAALLPKLDQFFTLAGNRIRLLDSEWDANHGSPVFTINGKYTTQVNRPRHRAGVPRLQRQSRRRATA